MAKKLGTEFVIHSYPENKQNAVINQKAKKRNVLMYIMRKCLNN